MKEPFDHPEELRGAEGESCDWGNTDVGATADEGLVRTGDIPEDGEPYSVESLRSSLRESAKYLLGAEALREIDQFGHNIAAVMTDVVLERYTQDARWGERHFPPEIWLVQVMEAAGTVAATTFNSGLLPTPEDQPHWTPHYQRIILLAATCVAWAEQLRLNPPGSHWAPEDFSAGDE
jgi:hypothetical protein